MLEVEGKAVSRGAEAISEFSSGDYDAVLLDLRLPDMSGIEVVSIIRSMEETAEVSTGKRIPLICVTASALKDESDQAFSAGVDRCLTKPVSLEQLQGVLNSCLSNRTKIGL